jgi:hypothetical protein
MRKIALLAEPDSETQADLRERLQALEYHVVSCASDDEYIYHLMSRTLHPTVMLASLQDEDDVLLSVLTLWPGRPLPPLPPTVLWTPGGEDALREYLPYLAFFPIKILPTPVDPVTAVALAVHLTRQPYPHYASVHDQIRRGADCTARDPSHHRPRRI